VTDHPADTDTAEDSVPRNAGASSKGRKRDAPLVLIVDDHADSREMYSLYLASQRLRFLVAGDDITAIRVARAMPPDVILMDLAGPRLDGWEAVRRLKQDIRTAHIPILACNGHADDDAAEQALHVGCDAYVVKPCVPVELLKQIRGLLRRSRSKHGA